MTPKLPISVFIIAKNEEDRIGKSIASCTQWADEVIVIDSGSTDQTVHLSEQLGAKVIFHAWQGYRAQKIFGEQCCRHPWILNIDADEEVSPELQQEIQALFAGGKEPSQKAFHLRITIVHRFDTHVNPFAPCNSPLRLYHRAYATFDSPLNDHQDSVMLRNPLPPTEIGHLKGHLLHRSVKSITHSVEKANFWTTTQAQELFAKGRCPSKLRIALEPFTAFFKAYFLRRYFVYGFNGFVDSVLFALSRFMRLAKAREYFLEVEAKNRLPGHHP